MRNLIGTALLAAGILSAQVPALDANSIVVTTTKAVVLAPTDVTFLLNVNVDLTTPLDEVLAAVDFGLTVNDLVSVASGPPPGGPSPAPGISRVTYTFRLSLPFSNVKDTIDKLETLRKSTNPGVDLSAQSLAAAAGLQLGAIQAVSEYTNTAAPFPGPISSNVTVSAVVRFAVQP